MAQGGDLHMSALHITANPFFTLRRDHAEVCPGFDEAISCIDILVECQPGLLCLNVASAPLDNVPKSLRYAANLERLSLDWTGLQTIPEWLFELPRLLSLSLVGNHIADIPESASGAVRLKRLNLSGNPLSQIPVGICGFSELRVLKMINCPLVEISADVLRLAALKELEIGNSKGLPSELVIPPPEVAIQGLTAIKRYWVQERAAGLDYLTEAKLLIVGEPAAGKTSLAKKILDRNYALDTSEESTQGIDVLRWQFPAGVRVIRDGVEDILQGYFHVNIWDFGGQEIYHATHQFFLTKRSTYVLVTDDRKEDTDLEYWLEVVDLLSGGSPLVIVQNCKQGRRRTLDLGALHKRYPNLCGAFSLDLSDNSGLDAAVDRIRRELESLPHVGTPLPKTWRDVRLALESDSRNHISAEEFFRICSAHGFTELEDMKQLGGFLHDLGICLFFQDDLLLRKTVILKPEWGTRAVYRLLDDPVIIAALGVFGNDDLQRIWREQTYAEMRGELIRLMTRFALCYPVAGSMYVAPQLLSPTQPIYDWDDTYDLTLRYEYDVMPKGIVRRIIVELHDLIEPGNVWRTGVVFVLNGSRAEVVEEYHRRRIKIRINGDDARILLDRVDRALDIIHSSYPDIEFCKYRPCTCPDCADSSDPTMFAVDHLIRFAKARRLIQCQRSMEPVNAGELLADLAPRERARRRATPTAPEVFVSYKWGGNAEEVTDSIIENLSSRGVKIVRDRSEVRYRDSIRDFMRRLGSGDAIIVIIDRAYLESDYCMFELTEIAAKSNLADRVFPIILPDAEIFDPLVRLRYVRYWDDKRSQLDREMRQGGLENLRAISEYLDLYEAIRNTIAGITDALADMNTLTPDMHRGSNFAQLYDALQALNTRSPSRVTEK
jgi:hypothetical protein